MDKLEYLKQGKKINKQMERLKNDIEIYKEQAREIKAIVYQQDKITCKSNKDTRFILCLEKVEYLESQANQKLGELIELKLEMKLIFDELDNINEQQVLEYIYIKNKTVKEIAAIMGYTEKTISRIRNKAIKNMELPEEHIII